MKKVFKLIVAILIVSIVLPISACGPSGGRKQPKYDPQSPNSLKLVIKNMGFGVDWAYDIAEAFMTTHPGKTVTIEEVVVTDSYISQLEIGKNVGDLFMFNEDVLWKKWSTGIMEELDDVVASIPDGEEKSVYDKMNKSLIDAYKVSNGHFYSLPWLNENQSFVYNASALDSLLGAGNWELPKTTFDLWTLCEAIKSAGGHGFVWNIAYINTTTWSAQYNGVEKNRKYMDGFYYDGSEWKLSNAAQCVEQNTGYLRAVENLHKMVNHYSHPYSKNMSHIYAQSAWAGIPYVDPKPSVFMPNGDWTYNETEEYILEKKAKVGFMQTPIISDIVETLDLYTDDSVAFGSLSDTKKKAYDTILNNIIDYIDNNEEGERPQGVSDNDISRIREARQIIASKCQSQAFISSVSIKKELAKEFLVFMASDMAINIFSQSTYGFSPFVSSENYDEIEFDVPFMNEVKETLIKSQIREIRAYTDIRNAGYGLPKGDSYAQGLVNYSPSEFFQRQIDRLKTDWPTILKNAGLSQ